MVPPRLSLIASAVTPLRSADSVRAWSVSSWRLSPSAAPEGEEDASGASASAVCADEEIPVHERVQALAAMVAHGVDEQAVTLTFLSGIGGTLARRLHEAGIEDIEDLALAEADDVAEVRGISRVRAAQWIEHATELIRTRSALCLRETGATTRTHTTSWPTGIDPYRLRRALDLRVRKHGDGFSVSGGLEPHRVRLKGNTLECDCADFSKGTVCKHVLAARLHSKDPELAHLVESLSSKEDTERARSVPALV